MNFEGICVYLGSSSFTSRKNNETYYLLKLHLPNGDIHDFFIEESIFIVLNFNLYDKVKVAFEMKSFNRSIQVSVNDIKLSDIKKV